MMQSWQMYDDCLKDSRIDYTLEPIGLENYFQQFTQQSTFSHDVWNDAYLATFAIAGGYELITFDQGFWQYAGLTACILP